MSNRESTGPASTPRLAAVFLVLVVALLAVSILRLCTADHLAFAWPSGPNASLILQFRVTRLILAVLVGLALAGGGVALQGLLRNPLAEPFILGLSSGAALGVMAQTWISYHLNQPFGANHLGALAGALLTMAVVYLAGRRRGVIDPLGLLLTGVVLTTLNGALIMFVNYASTRVGQVGLKDDIARWMMGYLNEGIGAASIEVVAVVILGGLALLWWQGRAMDVATFSDAEATSLGVNVGRLRVMLFVVASALAAGAVVLAGPIAFVGLICPHLARLLVGPGHRTLLVASVLVGAVLMVTADTAVVAADFGQGRMPIGIFTALIGGPMFLWMLRPYLGRGWE